MTVTCGHSEPCDAVAGQDVAPVKLDRAAEPRPLAWAGEVLREQVGMDLDILDRDRQVVHPGRQLDVSRVLDPLGVRHGLAEGAVEQPAAMVILAANDPLALLGQRAGEAKALPDALRVDPADAVDCRR